MDATWKRSPDLSHEGKYFGFISLQFTSDEGIKIIRAEVALSHLGKELFLIIEAIVLAQVTGAGHDRFVFAAVTKFLPCGSDARLFKPEHLIVISVRELVQNNPWHAVIFKWRKKAFHLGNVNTLHEIRAVAVVF